MHSAELVRHDNSSGRSYYVLQLPNFESWPEQLPLASRHFALFIASDARQVPSTVIGEVALTAIKQGAVYVCAWGPGCEVVHDVFDEAKVELDLEKAEDDTLMTTWHQDEPLTEALWFFTASALPDDAFETSCTSWLAVSVGLDMPHEHIHHYLANPESLDHAVGL